MRYNVPMPSLGADMDQGKLMLWKIKSGDDVKKGQIIATVETTKSAVEIESFREGKVLELVGKEGEELRVGSTIAIFDVQGEEKKGSELPRIKISPAAKKLASQMHVDLSKVKGSGSDGQIELKDVQTLVNQQAAPTSRPASVVNIREAIAMAMSRSKKEIPHYYLKTRIILDALLVWIDEKNKVLPAVERLMVPTVLMKGIIQAIKEYPMMNGYYVNGAFEAKESVNLGIAVALKSGGVLVPAIMSAESMDLARLNSSFQDLLIRTRKNELKNRELTEGTITVTNVGDLGSHEVFGIIFPPQVALVGLGRIHKSAVEDNGLIRSGFIIDVTLSADHRLTDGLLGSRFLAQIEKIFLNPTMLEGKNESTGIKINTQRDLPRDSAGDSV
jgi:pyruvate dehydrogenase E2 component (dihydrolipoamide acetyltransferase)